MKISDELAELINKTSLQLCSKFDIFVGFAHPGGMFVNEDDDFVIIKDGNSYLIEFNPYEYEGRGIFARITSDLEKRSARIDDFLINFHQWLKNGDLIIEEWREASNFKWKPTGDGRYLIEEKTESGTTSYCCYLEEIENPLIKKHIFRRLKGK